MLPLSPVSSRAVVFTDTVASGLKLPPLIDRSMTNVSSFDELSIHVTLIDENVVTVATTPEGGAGGGGNGVVKLHVGPVVVAMPSSTVANHSYCRAFEQAGPLDARRRARGDVLRPDHVERRPLHVVVEDELALRVGVEFALAVVARRREGIHVDLVLARLEDVVAQPAVATILEVLVIRVELMHRLPAAVGIVAARLAVVMPVQHQEDVAVREDELLPHGFSRQSRRAGCTETSAGHQTR